MKETNKGLKLLIQYSGLILLLAAFNFYNYYNSGRRISLIVAIVCLAALVGWILFYLLFVRSKSDS
jgi:hypothetical protein